MAPHRTTTARPGSGEGGAAIAADAHERKLAFAATHTPNAVLITDSAGRVEWVNESLTRFTGLEAPAVVGRTFGSVLEQIGAPPELFADSTAGESPFRFELCIRQPDTAARWLLVTGQPAHDAGGRLTFWMVVANDVTALKDAQDTIDRRARQALHYKNVLLGLVQSDLSDLNAALRLITERAAQALGLDRVSVWFLQPDPARIRCACLRTPDSTSHPPSLLLAEAEHPRYFAALREHQAIDAHDAEHDPRTSELAEDYLRPLDVRSMLDVPIWADGAPIGVLCHEQVGTPRRWLEEERAFANSVADVVSLAVQTAERRRAEAALRVEQQQAQRLIATAPIIIAGMRPDGITTFINPAGERITGYPAADLVGRNWWQTFYPSGGREELDAIQQAVVAGEVSGYEKTLTTRTGDRVTVAWDTINRYDEQGRLLEIVGFGRDVTARREMEAEQQAAREAAETASRLKSEFLATVSHEIRTPLNGVIGMADLLLDTPLADDQRDYAETARRSARTLLSIINDVLDFSKIEAGKLTLDETDFDLRVVIEDAIALVAEQAYSRGLEVSSVVPADLPVQLRGDAGRLRQVLANLLGNAVKFTSTGEVAVHVSATGLDAAAVRLRIEVTDTGIGVSSEAQARIFRPFTQADGSTTRRYGGTGLGLAISQRLVELLGGDIGVTSTPGLGSTFWFTARMTRAAAGSPGQSSSPLLPGFRLLLVDRPHTARLALAQMTLALAASADTVDTGEAALARLRLAAAGGHSYQAVLAARTLHDMDALALARAVRADPVLQHTAVVLVTPPGLANDEALRDTGVHALLVKPVRLAHLHGALASARGTAAPVRTAPRLPAVERGGPHHAHRILVAEDNPVNQKVAVKLLERLGCRVDVAATGREALQAVARGSYALVFMDCQMPDVDGFEATQRIRERERAVHITRLPIVAMTANALRGDRERCLAAGMDDYIAKPISRESLQAALDRWLTAEAPDTRDAV